MFRTRYKSTTILLHHSAQIRHWEGGCGCTLTNNPYVPVGGDPPELQLDALHYAAQDMNAYAATSAHKYIVLITDTTFHYDGDSYGYTGFAKSQIIDALTATECPVYISVWDPDDYYQLETDRWYAGLTVNSGQFDPSKDGQNNPTEPLYPLANLRSRILSDLQ